MLTVKIVLGQKEHIYSANSVDYDPDHDTAKHLIIDYFPHNKSPRKCVIAYIPRRTSAGHWVADPLCVTDGIVYVMNDAGSTIAKYDLRASVPGDA